MNHYNQKSHSQWKPFRMVVGNVAADVLLACATQAGASVTNPAIGQLLWSEEHDSSRTKCE